jgi:hypothetical protein
VGAASWSLNRQGIMNRDANHVFKQVLTAWDQLMVSMKKMYPATSVRPAGGYDVFSLDEGTPEEEVKFSIGPLVFNVPERAGRGHDLFIVVKGWLSFEGANCREVPLKTRSFGTEVGYFRWKQDSLEHVYGAHYDLDETLPGHPVFHAQFSSRVDLAPSVRELYRVDDDVADLFSPKIRNIRIPTAQMDVFSTIVQICADHLVYRGVEQGVHDAFAEMCTINSFFLGAAYRMPYLNTLPATQCYRSAHWYARPKV